MFWKTLKWIRRNSKLRNILEVYLQRKTLRVTVSESYFLNGLWSMFATQNRIKYMSSRKWNHYRETLYIQWDRCILVANTTPLFITSEVRRSPMQSKCASSLLSAARTSHLPYGYGNGFHKDSLVASTGFSLTFSGVPWQHSSRWQKGIQLGIFWWRKNELFKDCLI